MSRHRHSDENRVTSATPAKPRLTVEQLRRRATFRKLILLECGIIRHAPFADCGRPLWDLMAKQPWFESTHPPAEWYRLYRATRTVPETVPGSGLPWTFSRVNGHHAVEWIEQHADGTATDDQLLIAEEYFHQAEYAAEADRFSPPDDQRDEIEIRYGAASWLLGMNKQGPKLWNLLDYYLASFPGQFDSWGKWLPFHPQHHAVAIDLIDDILGSPLRSARFEPAWRTADAVAIASAMYETRDFSAAPILADALEDAGCDNADALAHCRAERRHCRGCWVVDLLLGKS
ncbi:hypothetical protein R5W24_001375 [Gemmata sp. JC717]|uniref:hypothetical protein n=1 Tax=Gemmata algarum TaxID=2975278 RepID=UPI0021BB1220|nr:hypothetical protein [Gemmata algarum]MDY3552295.1 hypothetical protein [Gemmata algarum]